jgi:hypothetical protein
MDTWTGMSRKHVASMEEGQDNETSDVSCTLERLRACYLGHVRMGMFAFLVGDLRNVRSTRAGLPTGVDRARAGTRSALVELTKSGPRLALS